MEELGGLILFLIMLGIAGLAKLSEVRSRKREEEDSKSFGSREEMPERTRKMLYGDDIPVAKARQQRTTRETQKRRPEGIDFDSGKEEPQSSEDLFEAMVGGSAKRATKKPPPTSQHQEALQKREEQQKARHQPTQKQRQVAQPRQQAQRQPAQQSKEQQVQTQQQRQATRQQQYQSRAAQRGAARLGSQAKGPTPMPSRTGVERVTKRAAKQSSSADSTRPRIDVLGDLDAVRRGIILSEILGKPRALKRPDEWVQSF